MLAREVSEMYCKLYVDSRLERDELARWLCDVSGGSLERRTVQTAVIEIDIGTNDEYRREDRGSAPFLYFRYLLDMVAREGARRSDVVGAVSQLLNALWASSTPAVASCDFEDELPRHGGIRDE